MSDERQSDTSDELRTGAAPVRLVRVEVGGRTHRGKVRPSNDDNFHVLRFGRYLQTMASSLEDAHALEELDNIGYGFCVADGLGGHPAGEVASRLAIALLLDHVLGTPDWIFAREGVHLAAVMDRYARRFGRVNDAVVARGRADPRLGGMATTLSVALSLGDDLIVAHVGDSPVYLFRGGRLDRLTRDHTAPAAGPGVPTADATRFHIALTHAIGIPDTGGSPDLIRLKLADQDRLLLCTDGLTDMVDDNAIAAQLGRASAADTCAALLDLALDRGGRDNVTVVVADYRFHDGARTHSPPPPGAGSGP